jgi:hypothetical protein
MNIEEITKRERGKGRSSACSFGWWLMAGADLL